MDNFALTHELVKGDDLGLHCDPNLENLMLDLPIVTYQVQGDTAMGVNQNDLINLQPVTPADPSVGVAYIDLSNMTSADFLNDVMKVPEEFNWEDLDVIIENERDNEQDIMQEIESQAIATPEYATPEHATPDYVIPEHATPEYTTPEYASPMEISPSQALPDYATPNYPSPMSSTSGYATLDEEVGPVVSPQEVLKPKSKRGRKRKYPEGQRPPRQRRREPRVKAYEMGPLEDPEQEKKRLNALNAKRHRDLQKQKRDNLQLQLDETIKERDELKRLVERLKRNEVQLKGELDAFRSSGFVFKL